MDLLERDRGLIQAQANMHFTYSQRRVTLSTRTNPRTQQSCWLTFTDAMIDPPWSYRPRYRSCWRRVRGFDRARRFYVLDESLHCPAHLTITTGVVLIPKHDHAWLT